MMKDNKYKYFVGIDVSKKTLDIALNQGNKNLLTLQVSNDKKGLDQFFKALKARKLNLKDVLFCAEKTGDYSNFLANYLHEKSQHYWEECPLKIKNSLRIQRGKSDQVDAKRIATYAYRHQDLVQLYQPKNEVLRKMEQLSIFRILLVKIQTMLRVFLSEKVAYGAAPSTKVLKVLSRGILLALERTIKTIDVMLSKLVKEDESLHKKHKFAVSVPGIGPVISMMLLIKTNGYCGVKSAKQLSCYMGLAPFEYSSGSSVKGKTRVSVFGNKQLKSLMHMGSLSILQRKKGDLYEYYIRRKGDGKHTMSVLNALKNKQLARVFACIRDEKMYREVV